ncbi:hypothetical protein ABPG72_009915 [Tetrahymena utriculariae]
MKKIVDAQFALNSVKKFVPSFANLQIKNVSIERMTGITNQTFRFTHVQEEIEPKDVIFRVFGKTCEGTFINRNDETIVYQAVADVGLGPKMLGYDNDIRVEEFLYSNVLKQEQMNTPLYRRKVAITLAEFHQIEIKEITRQPMLKQVYTDPSIIGAVEEKINKTELFTQEELGLIEEMRRVWFSRSEHDLILSFFPEDTNQEQILFCHNDLLANNVLILNNDNSLRFIDFEYSHYNVRSFDIGNYFNESQYDYNVSEEPYFKIAKEPLTEQDYKDFINHYVLGFLLSKNKIPFNKHQLATDEDYFKQLLTQVDNQSYLKQTKSILEQELLLGICLSHFYWGIWALHMSKDPNICFNYVKFSYSRFQKYQEARKQLIEAREKNKVVEAN